MLIRVLLSLAIVAGLVVIVSSRSPRAEAAAYQLEKVAEGFKSPVGLTSARDGSGRIFVVEQPGRIVQMKEGKPGELFLDISHRIVAGGEMGLLSVAFHPKFKENGRCFLNYTVEEQDQLYTIVSEMTAPRGASAADPKTEKQILKIKQPYTNHNGGQTAFGPDGHLYIGMGDGGAGGDPHNNGQNMETLLGKMLRIDVDSGQAKGFAYMIPASNPWPKTKGVRPEIWAYGLRNPWRFSFDRVDGTCWAADVGQNAYEEIDIIERGKNYGWRVMEGKHCFEPREGCKTEGLALPVKEYGRDLGVCVTGGYVYRGKERPELVGAYVYGDYGSGRIWSLRVSGGKVTEDKLLCSSGRPITSFGEDEAGELYVVTHEGRVWKLVPK